MALSKHEARMLAVLLDLKKRRESRILKTLREKRERIQANLASQNQAHQAMLDNRKLWQQSCQQGFSSVTEQLEKNLYSHYGKYHQYELDRRGEKERLRNDAERLKSEQIQLEASLRLNRAGQEKFHYLLEHRDGDKGERPQS